MLSSISCSTFPDALSQQFQDALDEGLEQYGGKGISVSIIIPGEGTWNGVSGISYGDVKITPDTVFSAGSITKTFTAAVILQLVEEGLISLGDTISEWLPEYDNIDSTITIRQLLNHTNGIFNFTENSEYWQVVLSQPAMTSLPKQVVREFTQDPYFLPGDNWHYSNTGYLLLRMIIEKVTNNPITDEYHNHLWDPFNLDMYLVPFDELPDQVAHGWFDMNGDGNYDDMPLLVSSYRGLGGGAFCTAENLALWADTHYHRRQVLSQDGYQQMFNFHTPTPNEPIVEAYGLGVVKFTSELFNNLEIWGHGGNAPGYAAGCMYLPDYGVSIGIMTNTEVGETMPTINDLLNIIITNVEKLK